MEWLIGYFAIGIIVLIIQIFRNGWIPGTSLILVVPEILLFWPVILIVWFVSGKVREW